VGLAVKLVPIAFLFVASAASAQEADARRLYERGSAAYQAGRHAEAVDYFQQSLDLARNAGTAFELANALRFAGRPVAAVETFDGLLDGEFGAISNAQRQEVGRLRRETLSETALVVVAIEGPSEAEVRVDGDPSGTVAARSPLEVRVDPGDHVVRVAAPRYLVAEERLALRRGERRAIEVELAIDRAQALARLVLEAEEPEYVLEIVDVARGTGSLERELEPGDYEVRVSDGDESRTTNISVEPGSTTRLVLDLEAAGSAWSSPFLWLGVGVGVAGLVAAGILLFAVDRVADPIEDPFFGNTETLRAF
jgi:tetratricopeptide (TPR) repeat protein